MRSVPYINKIFNRGNLLLLVFTHSLSIYCFAQDPKLGYRKFSPALLSRQSVIATQNGQGFVIAVSDSKSFRDFIVKTRGAELLYEYAATNCFLIRCTWRFMSDSILPRADVLFIDTWRTPKEEVAVSNFDISANKINMIHALYPQFNGNTLGVSVKENRPDTQDIDIKGRYQATSLTSSTLSSHATIMSTIIGGAGNTYYEGRGVAQAVMLNSVSFATLLPEPDAFYQQTNSSVQNHSYGTGIENFYGADAAAYDASVTTRPSLLHVFSAGNSGTQSAPTGIYSGIPSYANITGSFKMAKNLITVGHTDSFHVVLAPSSRGPAYDGRISPGLVAFGEDGSSGAAAIVSGIALTVQQAYKEINGSMPSSALVRSVLYNSADDIGTPGPDFTSGYGSANAVKALQTILDARFYSGTVGTGGTVTHSIAVPTGTRQLRITMAWNDPAATANAPKALRNDMDLEVEFPSMGQTWLPWVLSHFPHIDSLQKPAGRKRDSLNTAEQVTIDNPVPGNYVIRVRGFNVPAAASQEYFLSYQFDTSNRFRWQYPMTTDNIHGNAVNTIRWENSFPATTGTLDYSLNNGASWQAVSNAIDLGKGYYKWMAPDTFSTARLRMSFSSQQFISDLFTISKKFNPAVGFNCADSFLFYWNKQKGVTVYQVYQLGNRYMEPLITTNDTLVVLGKTSNPAMYYAVAPVLNGKTGLRTVGFNYSTQGVGCYIRSFFASSSGSTGILDLELGTIYGIRRIHFEKKTLTGFITLQTINTLSGFLYDVQDPVLKKGLNVYRVKIERMDGSLVYSSEETIYYFENSNYIVYPNPVQQGQQMHVLARDVRIAKMQIIDAAGRLLFETMLTDLINLYSTDRLNRGFYFLRFTREGEADENLRLIVQ